jgi:hypothetical protein
MRDERNCIYGGSSGLQSIQILAKRVPAKLGVACIAIDVPGKTLGITDDRGATVSAVPYHLGRNAL